MTFKLTRHRVKVFVVLTAARMLVGTIAGAHPEHLSEPVLPPDSQPTHIDSSSPRQAVRRLQHEITFYQNRIRRNPTDGLDRAALASVYVQLARATGDAHWYHQAAQSAQASLRRLPYNNQGAQLVLARVAEAQHDFEESLRLTHIILQTQPTHTDALALQVTANLAKGDLTAANLTAQRLVEQTPTLGTLTLSALVEEAQGQEQPALQAFQQALNLAEPDQMDSRARTHTLLGRFYAHRGELVLAQEQYQAALKMQPDDPLARLHLAELSVRQGDLQAAADRYTDLYRTPATAQGLEHDALYGMAQVRVLQGDRQAAEALWQEAEAHLRHDHDEQTFGHRRDLAQLLLARGHRDDLPEALSLMQAEVNIRRDAKTLDTWAWALSRAGRWQEAQQALEAAIALGTQNAGIFYRAGTVAQALGQQDTSTAYFQKAQAIDPTFNHRDRLLSGVR